MGEALATQLVSEELANNMTTFGGRVDSVAAM